MLFRNNIGIEIKVGSAKTVSDLEKLKELVADIAGSITRTIINSEVKFNLQEMMLLGEVLKRLGAKDEDFE